MSQSNMFAFLLEARTLGDHELVDEGRALGHVGVAVGRELRASLAPAKGGAGPRLAGDELQRLDRHLGAARGNADDARLAPALVQALDGGAHDLGVANALEGVVEPVAVGLPNGAFERVTLEPSSLEPSSVASSSFEPGGAACSRL